MRSSIRCIEGSLGRLCDAVDDMHRETVACRRNMMALRARMDTAEQAVTAMAATLEKTLQVLAEAEAGAHRAGAIFRATAAGRAAE